MSRKKWGWNRSNHGISKGGTRPSEMAPSKDPPRCDVCGLLISDFECPMEIGEGVWVCGDLDCLDELEDG